MTRTVHLHTFSSAKGGVGKSTLAVARAMLLAARKESVVLIDADLSGTSLADGLRLQAPMVPAKEDGTLDLDAPPTGEFFSVSKTRSQRRRRVNAKEPSARFLPYFNDALNYQNDVGDTDCRVDALLWKHEHDNGIRYLPSSPAPSDISLALGKLYWTIESEPAKGWSRRFCWLLEAWVSQLQDLQHLIFDLPPGLFGFSHAVFDALSTIARNESLPEEFPNLRSMDIDWRVSTFLVTSQDPNDLQLSLEAWLKLEPQLPGMRPILNRAWEPPAKILAFLQERFEESPGLAERLAGSLVRVDDLRETLGRMFLDGQLRISEDWTQRLKRVFGDQSP